MSVERKFSFAEIVQGRDASVRVTEDNLLVAVDLVMVASGKTKNDAGKDLRELKECIFSAAKFTVRTLPGKGNSNIKLVSLPNAIELIMVLPGKIAKETRSKFADIIRRYLGGDKTLISEIEANAASVSPIAQLARASMAPVVEIPTDEMLEDRLRKREREDIEIRGMGADIQSKKLCNVRLFADTMSLLNPHWADDSRLRLQTEDWLKNIAFNSDAPASAAITNGEVDSSKSISVSQVAQEIGARLSHGQRIQIGSAVAKRYREKYGSEPPKHSQWVDGAERKVNSYTERDRAMVVEVLHEVLAL